MAHFGSSSTEHRETETAASAARNARFGRWLFALYLAFYATFVLLVAVAADSMRVEVAGVSVAILYGLGLIGGALVLAVVYLMLCGRKPD